MAEEDKTDIIYEAINKIMTAIDEDENITMLNQTDLLLKMLEKKFKKEHELETTENKIKNFLQNTKNMRILRMQQKIKRETETAIEYYDRDIGRDERLFYQEKLEEDITKLQEEIRRTLSIIIIHKIAGEIDLG
jgi:hypothetical protein